MCGSLTNRPILFFSFIHFGLKSAAGAVVICAIHALQDPNAFDYVMQNLREKMEGKQAPILKRPAAGGSALKRPAAASESKLVKPSTASSSKSVKSSTAVMKVSKAKKGAKGSKPPNALKMYPRGCPKCRWKAGRTPSCFRYRGEWP